MRRRRRPIRRRSVKRQVFFSVCLGLCLGILLIYLCNTRLRPAIITIASDHLSNQISEQICDVVNEALSTDEITYDSICTVQWDSAGNIAALQTDMARLNRLSSAITADVASEFDDNLIDERIKVPLGSLLPGLPFSGRGPSVSVVVLSVGNISAEFENEFFSVGINQTLHRVVMQVSVEVSLILPGGVYTYAEETGVILAETVLLGAVPDNYTYFSQADTTDGAYEAYYYNNAAN